MPPAVHEASANPRSLFDIVPDPSTDTPPPPQPPKPTTRSDIPPTSQRTGTSRHRQRRKDQSPRHHRRHPHAKSHRAGTAARHAEEKQIACPLRRLRAGRPFDFSRPGHRPLQGCRLAGHRRGAEDAADARGIRQRQAHHLQRLLHLARPSSPPSTRPLPGWACPPMPRSWNPAAARAIS